MSSRASTKQVWAILAAVASVLVVVLLMALLRDRGGRTKPSEPSSALELPRLAHESPSPRPATSATTSSAALEDTGSPSAAPPAVSPTPPVFGRDPNRAKGLREALQAMVAGANSPGEGGASSATVPLALGADAAAGAASMATAAADQAPIGSAPSAPEPAMSRELEQAALRAYVALVMQEYFAPLVGECYSEFLQRRPTVRGDIGLEFSIMGTPVTGAVVVDVEFGRGTTLKEEGFARCVKHGMLELVFEPPPPGLPFVSASQVLNLAP